MCLPLYCLRFAREEFVASLLLYTVSYSKVSHLPLIIIMRVKTLQRSYSNNYSRSYNQLILLLITRESDASTDEKNH